MENIQPLSEVRLEFTPVSHQHYAIDLEFQLTQNQFMEIKKYQRVMLAIECRSGLETENFKSLKSAILNLIFQLKESHVREIGLFWNKHVFDVATLPNKEISELMDQIAQEGKKGQDEQFSYTQTLMSLRHNITNMEKSLTKNDELFILFLSTQLALTEVLEDLSWQQAYMKWLFGRNKHKQQIEQEERKLRNKVQTLPCRNVIYSVGFGKYHDSDILQRMANLGTQRGNYFSALSINQLTDVLDVFSIIASGQISTFSMILTVSKEKVFYFVVQSDDKARVFKRKIGKGFIDRDSAQYLLTLQDEYALRKSLKGVPVEEYNIRTVQKALESTEEEIDMKLYYIDYLLFKVMENALLVLQIQREKDVLNENKYIYVQYFDQDLLFELTREKEYISSMFQETVEKIQALKMGKKAQLIDRTNTIRDLILKVQQIFANIYQKKFSYIEIGQLIGEASKLNLKRSLRKKLLKRINANPTLLSDAYQSINLTLTSLSYVATDVKYSHYLKEVGNCKYTGNNFVKSMFNEDCLAVAYTIHRPKAAIADPGRIKVKSVFHYPVSTANYISDYRMRNIFRDNIYSSKQQCYINQQLGLRWRIDGDTVVYIDNPGNSLRMTLNQTENGFDQFPTEKVGVLPLFICEENWKIAKELMKPALGWTVCDEPLAYATSQMQIVPFLVLEGFITQGQNLKYTLDELDSKIQKFIEKKQHLERVINALQGAVKKEDITPENKEILLSYYSENRFNRLKLSEIRSDLRSNLLQHSQENYQLKQTAVNQITAMIKINERYTKLVEETCQKIITQFSGPHSELPFNKHIADRFREYKDPINRTVDVIPNNFAFMAQLYCVIRSEFIPKPIEQDFHYFFQRLVEQQLRRETSGWKEEYEEDCFVNKLLNVEIEKIDHPTVVAVGSTYREKFAAALKGESLKMNEIMQKRQMIQLNIRKQDTFNVVQRMSLIQYKRLYESTALRLWYTRFRLYNQIERKQIHRWRSIGMNNSFYIFTMIIQNKTQFKNFKRREVILAGQYVDPFDYYFCVDFIERTFENLRQKVVRRNMQATIAKIFRNEVDAFVQTSDPVEAAGVLLDNTIGRNIGKFYEGLLHDKSPLLHIKLNMILTGHYDNVQLFTHKQGWQMSKQKMWRLRKEYPQVFAKYIWMM